MADLRSFGSLRHLAGRFVGALWPGGPAPHRARWAEAQLLPGEQALWRRMSGPDRRHAVAVAHRAIALLADAGIPADRPTVAAALLHDVGKVEARLGTVGRATVTAMAMVVGRTTITEAPATAWRRRAQDYLRHDAIGADLLTRAGSDPRTVAWAAEHHLPPARWTVDDRVGHALKAADDD